METFKIEVRETLSKIVEMEAKTVEEAILKVKKLYKNEKIILDSGDFIETDINEFSD